VAYSEYSVHEVFKIYMYTQIILTISKIIDRHLIYRRDVTESIVKMFKATY